MPSGIRIGRASTMRSPPPPPAGPVAVRAVASKFSDTVTLSFTTPAVTANGDALIAGILISGGALLNTPAGWTLLRSTPFSSNGVLHLFSRVAASEPATWDFTQNVANNVQGHVFVCSGSNLTSPAHAHGANAAQTTNTQIDAPSVTTTVAGCLLLRFVGQIAGNSGTWGFPPEVTKQADAGVGVVIGVGSDTANQAAAGATAARLATYSAFAGSSMVAATVAVAP